MLGSFAVGKTSLVRRFVKGIFSDTYLTTVGVKVDKKELHVDERETSLMLWDLYGNGGSQKLRLSYLRGSSGFLLVVDGTRRATMDDALATKEEAETAIGRVHAVLVLNKCDLIEQWEIDPEEEKKLTGRGLSIVRTSAKTGQGVEEAFATLARAMLRQ